MVNLSTAQITGLVSLALILSVAVVVENMEKSYYCAAEDNVKECVRLSSSGLTCYYLTAPDVTKGDRCMGGVWEALEGNIIVRSVPSLPVSYDVSSDDCIVKGELCYCNPRGKLENKRKC